MQIDISLDRIIEFLSDELINVYGHPESVIVKHLSEPERVDEFTLIDKSDQTRKAKIAEASKAKAIIADKEVVYSNY